MSSRIMQIVQAVTEAINEAPEGTFGLSFTAVAAGMIEENLAERQGVFVTVLPYRRSGSLLNRTDHEERPAIAITVQRGSTPPQSMDKIDEALQLTEALTDYMGHSDRRVLTLDDGSTVEYVEFEHDPPYLFTHLAELNTFTAIPALTYRLVR